MGEQDILMVTSRRGVAITDSRTCHSQMQHVDGQQKTNWIPIKLYIKQNPS